MATRVAVIGASGVGRHHAKWWALEGAQVCAIAGTSLESVARTRDALAESIAFEGRAYTDIAAMLAREAPDIVDVCSPPDCHAFHVRMALDAGCNVLCEKPFVYDDTWPHEDLVAEAYALVQLAEDYGRRLSVCTQYAAGAHAIESLWRSHAPKDPLAHYLARLETPARNRHPDPARIWMDLAPHLVSVLIALAPDAEIQWDTVHPAFKAYEASATFDAVLPGNRHIHCGLHAHNRLEPPDHVRHFALNRFPFVIIGEEGEDGHYRMRIESPAGTVHEEDYMRMTIRAFLHGQPLVDGPAAIRNLEWTLGILALARQKK